MHIVVLQLGARPASRDSFAACNCSGSRAPVSCLQSRCEQLAVTHRMAPVQVAIVTVFLALFGEISAQRLAFGKCPSYETISNFDSKKFSGKWYEVERSFYLLELASSCTSLQFSTQSSGKIKVVVNSINRWTGSPSISLGTATPSKKDAATLEYKVHSRLPTSVARMLPGAGIYSILYTDYDNYAILYSCSDLGVMHADLVWVLGRDRELSVSTRAEVYNKLLELNMDTDRLTLSKHKDCPSFY